MRLERTFANATKKTTTLVITIDKGQIETILSTDGKEKRESAEASNYVFERFAKLVKKYLGAGSELLPSKNPASVADALLGVEALDLDLDAVLDVFGPTEREAIVTQQIRK